MSELNPQYPSVVPADEVYRALAATRDERSQVANRIRTHAQRNATLPD